MAPAITHFLIGAACSLIVAVPIVLRYDLTREHAWWLVPLGGVSALIPGVHHVAPIAGDSLSLLHLSPWNDLFGFHYTLDRLAARTQDSASLFGAIAVFLFATVGFWTADRVRHVAPVARRPPEHAAAILTATGLASGVATLPLWIAVSVQQRFSVAAQLVGSSSELVGGVAILLAGGTLGVICAVLLELCLAEPTRIDPPSTAGVGLFIGVGLWLIAVPVVRALAIGRDMPVIHLGSLGTLVTYGVVCGTVYGIVRGAFSSRSPVRLTEN